MLRRRLSMFGLGFVVAIVSAGLLAQSALAAPTIEGAEAIFKTLPNGIKPRELWARGQCPPAERPEMGMVGCAFIAHAYPTTNDYREDQVPEILQYIYRAHRANGWSDIGYNFVVDRFGGIWETRDGGIHMPVIGSHTYGFNRFSTGVAFLGSHSNEPASDKAIEAAAALLVWKLRVVHGNPVTGKVTVMNGDQSEKVSAQFKKIVVERIAAHSEGTAIESPGAALRAQLDQVRFLAEQLVTRNVR